MAISKQDRQVALRLERLIQGLDVFDRPAEARRLDITVVTEDTREVVTGALFCCIKGSTRDGHDLAAEAVSKGAVALVVERELDLPVPQIRVSDARAALAPLAAAFYEHPARRLKIVGITGTNGKTTTAQLLTEILQAHRWRTGTIGTLVGRYTNPPPPELHRRLAEYRDQHHQAVVMEVSSHALVQHRVDAITYDVGVFTNLTQDHLDYHRTMNEYFEAKAILFEPGRSERAVINIDDEWGRKLVDRTAVPTVTYSLDDVADLDVSPFGSTFRWQQQTIRLPLIGRFNVYNALAAAMAARSLGVQPEVIAQALSNASPVRGRVEPVDRGQPFTVLVDYAHTPDGLSNVLLLARTAAERMGGRVIVVFGGFGDRDRGKRPQMGAIAEQLADVVVITTDNARSEEPEDIANEVLAGMTHASQALVELDRARAIHLAVATARKGDVVVIAGKGHETTQDIKGVKRPFDDRAVAEQALDALAKEKPTT